MKTRIITTTAVMLMALTGGIAQHFGLKAGENSTSLSSDLEVDPSLGWHAGLLANFQITPQFSLQPELLYSQEGATAFSEMEEEDLILSSEEKVTLSYLNLPVMLKFYPTQGLSLNAGPQLGYVLKAENEYQISTDFGGAYFEESGTEDITEEVKKFALGINLGLAYDLTQSFFLEARYHLGLTDIQDIDEEDEDFEMEREDIKNSGFQFSLGYRF